MIFRIIFSFDFLSLCSINTFGFIDLGELKPVSALKKCIKFFGKKRRRISEDITRKISGGRASEKKEKNK